jgi:hypothetical protein
LGSRLACYRADAKSRNDSSNISLFHVESSFRTRAIQAVKTRAARLMGAMLRFTSVVVVDLSSDGFSDSAATG